MYSIRKANETDAPALAQIAEQTFRATFASVNSAADMQLHCQNSYSPEIQAAEIASPSMLTLLCEKGADLIGFAQLRTNRVPACISAPAPVEIQRLYVASQWHGKGVAQQLMQTCIDEALNLGANAIWLGVWEHNPRAIAFYQKYGFVEAGDHHFSLGTDLQRDIIMVKPLTAG